MTPLPFQSILANSLDQWTLIDDAEKGNSERVTTVTLGAHFYFKDGHTPQKRLALAHCVTKLQEMYGEHLSWCISTTEGQHHYNQPNILEEIKSISTQNEFGKICASDTPDIADQYRVHYQTTASWTPNKKLSELSIRLPANTNNAETIKTLFHYCTQQPSVSHSFGGLVSALPWERHNWQPQEYSLSEEFFGILVGTDAFLANDLKDGILSPAWLLALNDEWYARIGGDSALTDLKLPSLQATHYPGGVILQAGDYPDPLPVSEGLPAFWRQYNAWLKPLRTQDLDCFHTASLDPVEQFDTVTTRMWCERMDEGAVWPPDAEAYEKKFQAMNAADDPAPSTVLTAHPGEPCPETGDWYAVNLGGKTVFVQKGEPMPGPTLGPTGEVIWHLRKA